MADTFASTSTATGAELYEQKVINKIGMKPVEGPQVGYLDKDKTALEIRGTITMQSYDNYFKFAFRKGDHIAFAANMDKGVRVQLLDSVGIRVLADSSGHNAKLKQAYADFKMGNLKLKNGDYTLKVTFDQGASRYRPLNYDLSLSSGMDFKSLYKTIASPATILDQMMSDPNFSPSYCAASNTASVLMGQQDGTMTNILDYMV